MMVWILQDPEWANERFVWRGGPYIEEEMLFGGKWVVVEALHLAEEQRTSVTGVEKRVTDWYKDVSSLRSYDVRFDLGAAGSESSVVL